MTDLIIMIIVCVRLHCDDTPVLSPFTFLHDNHRHLVFVMLSLALSTLCAVDFVSSDYCADDLYRKLDIFTNKYNLVWRLYLLTRPSGQEFNQRDKTLTHSSQTVWERDKETQQPIMCFKAAPRPI